MKSEDVVDVFIREHKDKLLCCKTGPMLVEMRVCVRKVLNEVLVKVSQKIAKTHKLFEFQTILSGSCRDRTKVSQADEMDVLCVFQNVQCLVPSPLIHHTFS